MRTYKQCITEHRLIVSVVLGKFLPRSVVIHHFDGNRRNNTHTNLVVCQDQKYHMLLHRRERAKAACGNPDWIKCSVCKIHDDPANLRIYTRKDGTGNVAGHFDCFRKKAKDWVKKIGGSRKKWDKRRKS